MYFNKYYLFYMDQKMNKNLETTEAQDGSNINFDTTQFYKILKTQLLKITGDFVREIDLSFDYIDKTSLKITKKRLNEMSDNDIKFKDFYTEIHTTLKQHKDNGCLNLNEKVKSKDFDFLSEVTLFGISFNDFKDEKKNTKKTLVNYLNEFYIISNFLSCSQNGNSTESLFNQIQTMVQDLVKQPQPPQQSVTKSNARSSKGTKQKSEFDGIDGVLNSLNTLNMSEGTGMDFSPFSNLMQNKDIMNIATELSSEMQSLDIDPMSMMSSIMSGNLQDNKIGSLISSIGTKLTQKIDSGAIDKSALEAQANLFMKNLSSNKDLMNFASNMNFNK